MTEEDELIREPEKNEEIRRGRSRSGEAEVWREQFLERGHRTASTLVVGKSKGERPVFFHPEKPSDANSVCQGCSGEWFRKCVASKVFIYRSKADEPDTGCHVLVFK